MVAATHRAERPYPARNRGCLSQSCPDRDPAAGRLGTARAGKPAIEVITDFGAELADQKVVPAEPQPARSPSASGSEPYRELIELGLARGRNARAIWQDLVDGHGFTAGYQSAQRYIRKLRGAVTPKPAASSRLRPVRKYKSIMAPARWCVIRIAAVIDGLGCSCSRWATAENAFVC